MQLQVVSTESTIALEGILEKVKISAQVLSMLEDWRVDVELHQTK